MVFSVSPVVSFQEKDLTNIIPLVSTSTAATVGQFTWGPIEEIQIIDNEEQLAAIFGKPTLTVYKDFLCSSSFLAYARGLQQIRVVDDATALNATATASAGGVGTLIKNRTAYDTLSFSASLNLFVAKYPGVLGNSIGVAWAATAGFNATDSEGPTWPWYDLFDSAPGTNEYHVVVYDATGTITGVAGTALERFPFVSTVATAKSYDGTSSYFKNKINDASAWIYVGKTTLLTGTSAGVTLAGGADGNVIDEEDRTRGFALLKNTEKVDISLVFAAGAGTTASKWLIDNVAEVRKDCIAYVSPMQTDLVDVVLETTAAQNQKTTRNIYGSSTYAFMDGNYKKMYDRYNDIMRWIPMNGDMAGLAARTDAEFDPWISPAGHTKGRVKNCLGLAQPNPLSIRDELYKAGINPVVSFPQDGPLLYGDKTLQTRPSAFDRVNVRRLFIVLEKAISTAAKFMLFEQNDDESRARFVNMIEPFLRDVAGRRGITDFRVVCDTSNNTGEVIDRNEFVADIYIKPTRSINFIKLNFVAVRTGVDFEEVVQGTASGVSL